MQALLQHAGVPPEQSALALHTTQDPVALQTLPPLSEQAVPSDAFAVAQAPPEQETDWQLVVLAVQA
jgi:hypothetical protein